MLGGLQWDELGASPALAGMSLACVNPEQDPGGRHTRQTCDLLAATLAR